MKILPGKGPGLTAREIAEQLKALGFEVTKRTVERDLNDLSGLFGIICNNKSTPYGWHWMPKESLTLPALSITDAVSFKLLEELLRPLLPSAILDVLDIRFRKAQDKLSALAKENPNARWVEKVRYVPPALSLLPPEIKEGILEAVQNALLSDKQIEVEYLKLGEKKKSALRLHPLGLVQRGSVTYLVATAFDYTDVRLYAVHRVWEVKFTDEAVKRPKGFKLDHYIEEGALQFGESKKIIFKAKVSEELAAILVETPLSEDQKLKQVNGEYNLTAAVVDSWQLEWWVLSQAARITVVAPKELRRRIAEELTEAVKGYGNK
ncbi:MAG: WYL domain-containing protein [Burkholderiales bacterium]|nr:WYL domain-containing protein [Burkholderiales bacterium]